MLHKVQNNATYAKPAFLPIQQPAGQTAKMKKETN